MRLTDFQQTAIKETFFKFFLKDDEIWLFGSRANCKKKGGDIDLYIETNYTDMNVIAQKKISFLSHLKLKIGDQKIDVIVNCLSSGKKIPIYDEAKATGIQLL